jgi:hypothetical protein
MIAQFPFRQREIPPLPVMKVVFVSSELQLATAALTVTTDTGADATFAPVALLEEIRAPVGEVRRAHSLWGEQKEFLTFVADVRIGNVTFPGIQVVAYDGNEIVLGRDVLNKLRLLLDGPAETTEMLESKPKRK